MSKYSPLTLHLQVCQQALVPMRFAEIEAILGFVLPPSSRQHRGWWINNPINNVMTKAWLAAGYTTRAVDLAGEHLVFAKSAPTPNKKHTQACKVKQKTNKDMQTQSHN